LCLLAGQLMHWRLPDNRTVRQALRLGVFTVIIVLVGWPQESINQWFLKPPWTNLVGCLLAAELVIRSLDPAGASRGAMLLLSCLTFAAAGDTYEPMPSHWITPLFVVLIMLSLRSFMPQDHHTAGAAVKRIVAGMLVIAIGFMGVQVVVRIDRQLQMLSAEFLRRHRSLGAAVIGLSTAPRLQAMFNPKSSMDRVLLISGPVSERYFRVLSFDTYLRTQWRQSLLEREKSFIHVNEARLHPRDEGTTLLVRVVGQTSDMLPLPLNAAGVVSPAMLNQEPQGALRFDESLADPSYEVTVSPVARFQGPICVPLNDAMRQIMLALPPQINARVVELARSVAGDGDPLSRVIKIAQHLRGKHGYSLSYDPKSDDPLASFILSDSAAHCEYFASALVIMARVARVPARLVTGYYAHESPGADRMVVRERDAHAWAECWIDGTGWITMDATPSGGRPGAQLTPPSNWRLAWETVQDLPGRIRDWLGSIPRDAIIATLLATAGIVLITGISQLRRNRRANADVPYAQPGAELLAVTRRFDHWLKRRVPVYGANRTWREHAMAIEKPAECLRFIEMYNEARFGGADGQALSRLHELMDNLEKPL